jgi:amino acid transporter
MLRREMGLLALTATGICSMIGAAINVIPFMIQKNVPGIGPWVLPAYFCAAVPAVLAALAYAILASAMPRAGGSYVYASRALSPYLGFVASFSQWFGLSTAIGVVSYVLVAFLRDIALPLGFTGLAHTMETGLMRPAIALAFLWFFVGVNLRGLKSYERTLIPLMVVMFLAGFIVIIAGFAFDQTDFAAAVQAREGASIPPTPDAPFDLSKFLAAASILFSSFIGFDSIAQAGGEAKNPGRNLPLAIGIAMLSVGGFYMLFTGAVYHAVPWAYVAEQAMTRDVTAPGLLGMLLSPGWTVLIVGGAAVALTNDLPAMLLAVSRLMFAWAEDGIFPAVVARVHPRWGTPHVALIASGFMASVGIIGSHVASDFFLGVDILVTSMLVNFLLMCASVLALKHTNPEIARNITVLPSRWLQIPLAALGLFALGGFLAVHISKDLAAPVSHWALRSTFVWVIVMAVASLIYFIEVRKLRRQGFDLEAHFKAMPAE